MSTPDPRLSQLQRMIQAYRQSILSLDDAALSRLQTAYAPSRTRLLRLIDALTGQISAGEPLSTSEVMQLGRARELLRLIDEEVTNLAQVAGETIPQAQQIAVQQAVERAQALTLAQAPDLASAARISAQWTALNKGAVSDLVGSLGDGSPLSSWIERVVPESVQTVRDTLLDGVTRGINPNDLAAALAKTTDLPLERALTLSRTETLRSYRSASLQSYQANGDVLDGWTWSAAHDSRTCSACLAKSGQDFPLSVHFMPSHPRCRCSPLPKLKDDSLLPQIETGEEWFNKQPEKFRRESFPPGLRGDYDAGRVTLADMAHLRRDEVWGNSYQTATISQARANAKARLARGAETKTLPDSKALRRKPGESDTSYAARRRIDQGINNEADVRELGAIVRPDIDKRIAAIQREYDEARADYDKMSSKFFDDFDKLEGTARDDAVSAFYKQEHAMLALKERAASARREATRDVIGEFRQFGSTRKMPLKIFRSSEDSLNRSLHAAEVINDQNQYLPKDWWDRIAAFRKKEGPTGVSIVERGHYDVSGIFLSGETEEQLASVAVHELTHVYEHANPTLRQLEKEFYERRTGGEAMQQLGAGYETKEITRVDQFLHEYIGKEYSVNFEGDIQFWEVASMGVENVLGDGAAYRSWEIIDDEDYYEFILGLIGYV